MNQSMKNTTKSLSLLFLLILAIILPIIGLLPGLYLYSTSKSNSNLSFMKPWAIFSIVLQIVYLLGLFVITIFFL